MAQIRYVGSKYRIRDQIIASFPNEIRFGLWSSCCKWTYIEPFFGSGAIGWELLKDLSAGCHVWVNDKDYSLVCLWKSVEDSPAELCRKIDAFIPSVDAFNLFKAEDGRRDLDPVELGFRKLALHQMSFSGLGVKSGGPLGGQDQSNATYNVGCRWNPEMETMKVWHRHRLLRSFHCQITCKDFGEVFQSVQKNCFAYCDPPYVVKGEESYKHFFNEGDHVRLRDVLFNVPCRWAVSYDDHPLVRRLYHGRRIQEVDLVYSAGVATTKRRKNHEILIFSD